MFFRRLKSKTLAAAPCQSCARIRAFLAVAGILIIAMPVFGEKAAPLGQLTPMGIALAMVGAGSIAFIARWIAWRREEANGQQTSDQNTNQSTQDAAADPTVDQP
jgi:hypothetical protein